MNGLEQGAVPLLGALLRGEPVSTDFETLMKLTEWALAAAIVRAEHGGSHTKLPEATVRAARAGGARAVEGAAAIFSILRADRIASRNRGETIGRGVATSAYASAHTDEPDERMVILWVDRIAVVIAFGGWSYLVQRAARVARRAALPLPDVVPAAPEWGPDSSITEDQLLSLLGVGGVPADAYAGRGLFAPTRKIG
jgi:hypothetical protein